MIQPLPGTDATAFSLSQRCFAELRRIYVPVRKARREKYADNGRWQWFGYVLDACLIAVVEAKYEGTELHLSTLAVEKKYRRKGIARKLIDGVIANYPKAQSVSLWCVAQTGNIEIFEALGFSVCQVVTSELFELTDGAEATEVQLRRMITT
ncbi:GNAT family N-acetyltransferase [Vibrio quintilis]|uniref:Acetyltransferase (GNAT) family protein n=1 Tax=Vibrio quintilis TaxID=1117707 RepID=A0A1M7YWG2_9VIBR|nr:GNAT family N-acetyltransferase [Vibrio quintilis]SHO57019.1 Acetyltransferase (GNAT) family protein [Vibrio quintilis]